jgi:hypothetical protein
MPIRKTNLLSSFTRVVGAGKPDGGEPSAVDSPALKAQLAMFSSTQLIKGLCPAIASLAGSLTVCTIGALL